MPRWHAMLTIMTFTCKEAKFKLSLSLSEGWKVLLRKLESYLTASALAHAQALLTPETHDRQKPG